MSIQLTVLSLEFDAEELPRNTVFSQDEITMGRDPINDVVLDSPVVSSHHVRIRVEENGHGPKLFITDLGSETGTILEDKKIQPNIEVPLPLNKRFTVGNFLIKPSEYKERDPKETKKKKRFTVREHEGMEPPTSMGETPSLTAPSIPEYEPEAQSDLPLEAPKQEALEAQPVAAPEAAPAPVATSENDPSSLDSSHDQIVAILVDGKDVGDLDFTAVELFRVHGKVLHKDQPLPGVLINAGALGTATTDADGCFSFADVLDGTQAPVEVSKEKFKFDAAIQQLHVNGSDTELIYRATELFTIAGKVVHKGVPMEGVEIDGGALGKTVTGADGSYCFKDVPDGAQYTLTARKGNFSFGTISARGK